MTENQAERMITQLCYIRDSIAVVVDVLHRIEEKLDKTLIQVNNPPPAVPVLPQRDTYWGPG